MPFQRIPRVSDLLPGAIKGLWTIGDPASWHVEIGTNAAGDSGIRLYGADGATKLIDLDVAGAVPSITSALIRTAASGARIELGGATWGPLALYTGDAAETQPGVLSALVQTIAGRHGAWATLTSPDVGHGQAAVTVGMPAAGLGYAAVTVGSAGDLGHHHAYTHYDVDGDAAVSYSGDTVTHKLVAGAASVTFDANGEAVIAHGLPSAPTFVTAEPGLSATSYSIEAGNVGASNFTIRMFRTDTGARAAGVTTFSVRWLAIT